MDAQLDYDLTKKQKLFCEEYVRNGRNATKAYLTVFVTNNYHAAGAGAHKLLKKQNVIDYIKYLDELNQKEHGIDRNMVLSEMLYQYNQTKDVNNFAALKALEMIAKLLGLNEENKLNVKAVLEQPLFFPPTALPPKKEGKENK